MAFHPLEPSAWPMVSGPFQGSADRLVDRMQISGYPCFLRVHRIPFRFPLGLDRRGLLPSLVPGLLIKPCREHGKHATSDILALDAAPDPALPVVVQAAI